MAGPSREELKAAAGRPVPDVIAPGLRVLFCGINPSLYTAAVGHHFARPGNRFWPTLRAAGFTPRRLEPAEQSELPGLGLGITNFVDRATASAAELQPAELRAGRFTLEDKLRRFEPGVLAVLGIAAFRTAFRLRGAGLGLQTQKLAGVPIWVLPNPSGLNAHYQAAELARLYRELRVYAFGAG